MEGGIFLMIFDLKSIEGGIFLMIFELKSMKGGISQWYISLSLCKGHISDDIPAWDYARARIEALYPRKAAERSEAAYIIAYNELDKFQVNL